MYKIEVCNRCRGTNGNSLIPKIRKLGIDVEIKTGCIQYCGIGRNKIVVLVNHIPVIGDKEEEVLEKINNIVQKNDN